MFELSIGATLTFWSHDAMVELIREHNDKFKNLQELNEAPWCDAVGSRLRVYYENVVVGEFEFGNVDYDQDTPSWQYVMDENRKYKFRLVIMNVWDGGHGAQAPRDIQIRPAGYDKSWKLAWRYKENKKSQYRVLPSIEIFRVDGENDVEYKRYSVDGLQKDAFGALWLKEAPGHVVYTLHPADFVPYHESASKWLSEQEPIVINKHETYITIRASAHLARSWSVVESHHDRPGKFFREHIMSDDEAAWISRDNFMDKKRLDAKDAAKVPAAAPAHTPDPGMHAMLATLQELAQ